MPLVTIAFGVILMIIGVGGYAMQEPGHGSPTALIPAAFGLVLAICGAVATKEKLKMHAMHLAVLIGLLGIFPTFKGIISVVTQNFGGKPPLASYSRAAMASVCIVYVILCVNSFIQARRARKLAS
jgi:hypothetical protein